jgi:hypothetical protein
MTPRQLHRLKVTVSWDVAPYSLVEIDRFIALMMEAVSISEMSINFYQTTLCNIPEYSHFHTRRRENLKSQLQRLFGVGL